MYVETDFLFAIAKSDDWLKEEAEKVTEREDIYTSRLAYTEFLVRTYQADEGLDFDAVQVIANLLNTVPIRPKADEEALLAAAAYLDEHEMTPFDALHAGIAATREESILTSDQAFEELDVERIPLEPTADDE